MEFEARGGKSTASRRVDSLTVAALRAILIAPGGFVVGYLGGQAIGRALVGCALTGPCLDATRYLLAPVIAILGMGAGCALASLRVRLWWEGVVVWFAGVGSTLTLVMVVGLLGVRRPVTQALALGWLMASIVSGIVAWRGLRKSDSN